MTHEEAIRAAIGLLPAELRELAVDPATEITVRWHADIGWRVSFDSGHGAECTAVDVRAPTCHETADPGNLTATLRVWR